MATVSFEMAVKVRLTKEGKRQFESFFGTLSERQQQPRSAYPSLPAVDADGWYTMELWMLLSVFGGYDIRRSEHVAELFEGNMMIV